MQGDLLRLSDTERAGLEILYLAKHAPDADATSPSEPDPMEGVVPVYHSSLYLDLRQLGVDLTPSRSIDFLYHNNGKFNYVFSILNRGKFRNSEVLVPSLCEYFGLAYLGARPNVRSLAEDKHLTKTLAKALDVATPDWIVRNCEDGAGEAPTFPGPYFVKARFGAASEWVEPDSLQDGWEGAARRIRTLHQGGQDAIVEKFIDGHNVTLPLINGQPHKILPCVEDICDSPGGILTYRQNRLLEPGMEREIFTDRDSTSMMHKAAELLKPHLEPIDYFRIDFRVDRKTRLPYLLEINVCCNLGRHSNIAIPALTAGISYDAILEHILSFSIRRQHVFVN